LGWVSAIDSQGRTIWIADAHRGDNQRFIVSAEYGLLIAFEELTPWETSDGLTRTRSATAGESERGSRIKFASHRKNLASKRPVVGCIVWLDSADFFDISV